MAKRLQFPEDKQFALAIVDDTDHGTVANLKPVYDLLIKYKIPVTKTTWVRPVENDLRYRSTETLANKNYREFVMDLKRRGFEIAWHGPAGESSTREQVIECIEAFEKIVGNDVTLHVNHQRNDDNLYWGFHQLPWWRRVGPLKVAEWGSLGHVEGSPFFWGDVAKQKIRYTRGNCYGNINTLKCDPYMPYYNPMFPYVNAWFSCSNGGEEREFVSLLSRDNLKRLKRERGVCIVYTHFGTRDDLSDPDRWLNEHGEIKPEVEEVFANLERENGWYAPVSNVVDFLGNGRIHRLTLLQRLRLQLYKHLYPVPV